MHLCGTAHQEGQQDHLYNSIDRERVTALNEQRPVGDYDKLWH